MKDLILNKFSIFVLLSILLASAYFIIIPKEHVENNYTETRQGENSAEPIFLGTSIPSTFSMVYDARQGIVKPFGGDADIFEHVEGNHASKYTAWLPISYMHEQFDENIIFLLKAATITSSGENCEGYILIKEINPSINNIIDMSVYYTHSLVLIENTVRQCRIISVNPKTSLENLKLTIKNEYFKTNY